VSEDLWNTVDQYISAKLVGDDAALEAALKASDAAGLPAIAVSPPQGKQLNVLAQMIGAKRVLEIGTLGGYSTIWLARAVPADGRVVTLEYDPKHAEVARENIARAGLADRVEVRVGPALESLPALEGGEPFDFFFIDADKVNNPNYYEWALKLSHPGSVIVVDNVVRGGAIADAARTDGNVTGTRALYDAVSADKRVTATAVQTVGSKGYDGYLIARVN
jgi:predicted O-methyltransferase YrrM